MTRHMLVTQNPREVPPTAVYQLSITITIKCCLYAARTTFIQRHSAHRPAHSAAHRQLRIRPHLREPERPLVLQRQRRRVAVCNRDCLVREHREAVPPAERARAQLEGHLEGVLRRCVAEHLEEVGDSYGGAFEAPRPDVQALCGM